MQINPNTRVSIPLSSNDAQEPDELAALLKKRLPEAPDELLQNLYQSLDAGKTAKSSSLTMPEATTRQAIQKATEELKALDKESLNADLYTIMALLQKVAQDTRDSNRALRSTESNAQISKLMKAADEQKKAADFKLAAGIVQGVTQLASGLVQFGTAVHSLRMEAKANDLATSATSKETAQTKSAAEIEKTIDTHTTAAASEQKALNASEQKRSADLQTLKEQDTQATLREMQTLDTKRLDQQKSLQNKLDNTGRLSADEAMALGDAMDKEDLAIKDMEILHDNQQAARQEQIRTLEQDHILQSAKERSDFDTAQTEREKQLNALLDKQDTIGAEGQSKISAEDQSKIDKLQFKAKQTTEVGKVASAAVETLGKGVSSVLELKANAPDTSVTEAEAKKAEKAYDEASDTMKQMLEVIRDIREKLQAIEQSTIATNRGMSRNI